MKNIFRNSAFIFVFSWVMLVKGIAQETRKIDPFDEIIVTGAVDLVLIAAEEEKVVVEAEGIPYGKVDVYSERGRLRIKVLESIFYKNEKVTVFVTYDDLRFLRAQAGADITHKGVLKSSYLDLKVKAGAQVELALEVDNLDASVGEGGVIELEGTVGKQDVKGSTGGTYDAYDLISQETYARSITGGMVYVHATERLEATAGLGGVVEYRGEPKNLVMRTGLGGDVNGRGKNEWFDKDNDY